MRWTAVDRSVNFLMRTTPGTPFQTFPSRAPGQPSVASFSSAALRNRTSPSAIAFRACNSETNTETESSALSRNTFAVPFGFCLADFMIRGVPSSVHHIHHSRVMKKQVRSGTPMGHQRVTIKPARSLALMAAQRPVVIAKANELVSRFVLSRRHGSHDQQTGFGRLDG